MSIKKIREHVRCYYNFWVLLVTLLSDIKLFHTNYICKDPKTKQDIGMSAASLKSSGKAGQIATSGTNCISMIISNEFKHWWKLFFSNDKESIWIWVLNSVSFDCNAVKKTTTIATLWWIANQEAPGPSVRLQSRPTLLFWCFAKIPLVIF